MPIPSKETAAKILETIETVNNMTGPTTQRPRRRIRTGGGGNATLTYIEITAATDANTYTATSFDNPVDRITIETGLTVKAIQHTKGTLPVTTAGKGYFAITSGSVLYIQPSIFSGA
tara:strand:+ start:7158 stop:7508 length:351 start_codon:yes stop_codon:yes gene_type:complete